MNIAEILWLKYPEEMINKDIILWDEGKGIYIKEWNESLLGPRPTQEDLKEWEINFDLQYRQNLARQMRKYPSWQEQMDMQYYDKVNNTTTWEDSITDIKLSHPIPQE